MGMLVLENLKQEVSEGERNEYARALYETSLEAKYGLKASAICSHPRTYRAEREDEEAEEQSKHVLYQGTKYILTEGFEGNEGDEPTLEAAKDKDFDDDTSKKLLAADNFLRAVRKDIKGKEKIAMWLRGEGSREKVYDKITCATPDVLLYLPPPEAPGYRFSPGTFYELNIDIIQEGAKEVPFIEVRSGKSDATMLPTSPPLLTLLSLSRRRCSSLFLSVDPFSDSRSSPATVANP